MNVSSGNHDRLIVQLGYNTAFFALHCRCRQQQNSFAPLRLNRTAHEIKHPGNTRKMIVRQRIGRHLTGQIDGHRNVHRNHFSVA